jgi:hypothetical protein
VVWMLVVNWPVFANFNLHSDDFSLILYSSRFGDVSVKQWFTTGFDPYFINFPSHPLHYTRYIRPVVNASIYFDSLIAPSMTSGWMMLGNVLSIAFSCGLVAVIVRCFTPKIELSYLAAIFLLCSYTNRTALEYISYRGDTLGAMLALLAILLVLQRRHFAWITALLFLAICTKETVAPAIVICAAIAYWRRYPLKQIVVLFLAPVAIYATWKVVTGGFGGTTLPVQWTPRQMLWNAHMVFQFFPFTQFSPIYNLNDHAWDLDGVRDTFAVALNVGFYCALAYAFFKRDRRTILLWLATILAGAVPLILYPEPRFRFFEQACAGVLVATMIANIARPRVRAALCTIVIAFSLGFYSVHLHRRANVLAQEFARSARVQRAVDAALQDRATRRVFYANDQIGGTGALTMLQLQRLHNHRDEVQVSIVSQILAVDGMAAADWQFNDGKFTARARAGRFVFWGATAWTPGLWDGVQRDGFGNEHLEARIPDAGRKDYAMVVDENDKALLYVSRTNQWFSFAK